MGQRFGKMSSNGNDSPINKGNQVIISASGKHTATLIFLHGLGDTGHGWASTLAEIRPSNVRIVCPTAPTLPVTLNSGFKMPAWFDLFSLDANGPEDAVGIKKAVGWIEAIIDEEVSNGVSSDNIVLGGFSQGGALALYTGLTTTRKLGGIVGLSCWLPLHKEFPAATKNSEVSVLQCHGDCDPVVPYKWGQLTSTLLKSMVKDHDFKTFRGLGHSSGDEEMKEVQAFINKKLVK